MPILATTQWNIPNWVDWAWSRERRACSEQTDVSWESGQRRWWLPSVGCHSPQREWCLHTPAPSPALQVSTLGWMFWCCHLEILTKFWTGGSTFSFCTGSHKLCCWSCWKTLCLVLYVIYPSSWLNDRAIFILILHIRKPSFNELKQLGSGPTANQWHNQDSKPGLPASKAHVLAHHAIGMRNPDLKISIWIRD